MHIFLLLFLVSQSFAATYFNRPSEPCRAAQSAAQTGERETLLEASKLSPEEAAFIARGNAELAGLLTELKEFQKLKPEQEEKAEISFLYERVTSSGTTVGYQLTVQNESPVASITKVFDAKNNLLLVTQKPVWEEFSGGKYVFEHCDGFIKEYLNSSRSTLDRVVSSARGSVRAGNIRDVVHNSYASPLPEKYVEQYDHAKVDPRVAKAHGKFWAAWEVQSSGKLIGYLLVNRSWFNLDTVTLSFYTSDSAELVGRFNFSVH